MTLNRMQSAGEPLPFPVTEQHVQAIDALNGRLAANGQHLSETNMGDFILTSDPNRPVVPVDMVVDQGVQANGGMVDHNGAPIRDAISGLVGK